MEFSYCTDKCISPSITEEENTFSLDLVDFVTKRLQNLETNPVLHAAEKIFRPKEWTQEKTELAIFGTINRTENSNDTLSIISLCKRVIPRHCLIQN